MNADAEKRSGDRRAFFIAPAAYDVLHARRGDRRYHRRRRGFSLRRTDDFDADRIDGFADIGSADSRFMDIAAVVIEA